MDYMHNYLMCGQMALREGRNVNAIDRMTEKCYHIQYNYYKSMEKDHGNDLY